MRAVRRANYFAVVQMFDCLPVVPKALQSTSSVLRTKALELVRIMALRIRDADRAAFIAALRSGRVCAAVMQRAQAAALCPPCLREIKAALAILGTITRLQIGSRASASRTGIDIALASWQHPRSNALLRVCLLEHMMCNFDTLDATEHKVQVEDIVRTVQVRVGIYFHWLGPEPVRDFGTERALVEPLGPNTTNFTSSCPRFTLSTELNPTVHKARPKAHAFDFIET